MKPAYTGQRTVSNTDRKFRPQDEHVIEENKEEVEKINHGDKMEPAPGQHQNKFGEVDRKAEKKK